MNPFDNQIPEEEEEHSDFEITPVKPEKIDYKSKDLELYNKWKETGHKKDLTNLVQHLSPIMYKEVSRAAGTLPVTALNAEAMDWTVKAIHTYDPSKGFALSTHVTNYVQRVRRMNYKYQHVARLTEAMKREYSGYKLALTHLEEELNREPTDEELAHKLGWSKPKVIRFRDRVYSDDLENPEEHPAEITQYSDQGLLMKQIIDRLTPEERFILQNKGKMSTTALAQKLNVNTNRFNYLHKKLVDKIRDLKTEVGMS